MFYLVVVELRLRRAGVLATENPKAAAVGRRQNGLVGAARWRRARRLDPRPRLFLDVVHHEVPVHISLPTKDKVIIDVH